MCDTMWVAEDRGMGTCPCPCGVAVPKDSRTRTHPCPVGVAVPQLLSLHEQLQAPQPLRAGHAAVTTQPWLLLRSLVLLFYKKKKKNPLQQLDPIPCRTKGCFSHPRDAGKISSIFPWQLSLSPPPFPAWTRSLSSLQPCPCSRPCPLGAERRVLAPVLFHITWHSPSNRGEMLPLNLCAQTIRGNQDAARESCTPVTAALPAGGGLSCAGVLGLIGAGCCGLLGV